MTRDDILQALRLTAMGRAGHPLQEQLADKLAECFAAHAPQPVEVVSAAMFAPPTPEMVAAGVEQLAGQIEADLIAAVPAKRTRKKAD